MAQHDMNIANQGFPATRADLNNALQALVSNSSGTSAPSTTFANQWWYDTTNNKMYIRNEANNAWIEVFTLDQTNNEWQLTTGVVQAKDSDGLALKTDDGTTRLFIKDSDGSIGLGTSSPTYKLDVNSGTTNAVARFESTDAAAEIDIVDSLGYSRISNNSGNLLFEADRGNANGSSIIRFDVDAVERIRIDSAGAFLVGKTTSGITGEGVVLNQNGVVKATVDGSRAGHFNRLNSDGEVIRIDEDGSTVGSIGVDTGDLTIYSTTASHVGVKFGNTRLHPTDNSGANADGTVDLGYTNTRWDTVYATTAAINTSDAAEKQQIASLTDAEITAAKAISKLFKTYKWNSAVEIKGDAARTHTGVIAQQVETAMSDAGLDAGKYAFFISTTWWETQTEVPAVEAVEAQDAVYEDVVIPAVEEVLDEDGNVVTEAQPERTEQRLVSEAVEAVEARDAYTRTDTYDTLEEAPEGATERNRKGIRYPELLSFIGAATEQRLTSIEARLDALEG